MGLQRKGLRLGNEDGECETSHLGIPVDTERLSHSGQQREKELEETGEHSLHLKSGKAGSKVCSEDRSGKIED